jgi:hypothetical protein
MTGKALALRGGRLTAGGMTGKALALRGGRLTAGEAFESPGRPESPESPGFNLIGGNLIIKSLLISYIIVYMRLVKGRLLTTPSV